MHSNLLNFICLEEKNLYYKWIQNQSIHECASSFPPGSSIYEHHIDYFQLAARHALIGTQKVNLYMMFISYNIYNFAKEKQNAEQPKCHLWNKSLVSLFKTSSFVFHQILVPLSTIINHHQSSIFSSRCSCTHAFAMAEKYQMHPNKLPGDKFTNTYSKCLLPALLFSRHWE